jgi:MFS family permease
MKNHRRPGPCRLRRPVQVPPSGHFRLVRHAVPSRERGAAATGGQKLAAAYPEEATAIMSACIVAAQLVMLPIALVVGRTADTWGRKPLFLAGFAVLPIRALLYTFSDNSFWLIGVQLLDGVGAGIFGALTPLVIADLMCGTGRYNLALGAVATVQGIGASLSGLFAGVIVDHHGYTATFLTLGAAATVALIVFASGMPETVNQDQ